MNFLKAQERSGRYFSKAMEKELPAGGNGGDATYAS
jgi:hypothetical protein